MVEKKKVAKKKAGKRKPRAKKAPVSRLTEIVNPDEIVPKLTEIEALRFAKIDAEARNDNQAKQLIDFEMADIKRKAEEQLRGLASRRNTLLGEIERRKVVYNAMVSELSEKYSVDAESMLIDPDTGTIRDLKTV